MNGSDGERPATGAQHWLLDTAGPYLFVLGTIPFLLSVSWLDAMSFFKLSPRLLPMAIWLLCFFIVRSTRVTRWVLGVGLIWLVLVLPQVRWNHTKSFYIDAHSLRRGMTEQRVREIMSPHLELGVYQPPPAEADWIPTPEEYPSGTLVFFHCPLGWTDRCEVTLDREDEVARIEIFKD